MILTALAGPVGSVLAGVGLARSAEASSGGMAGLAAGVIGLWLGAPLFALIVFAVCLVTVMRGAPLRRWVAALLMLAAVIVEAVVALIGLGVAARSGTADVGLVIVAFCAIGILGLGASIALRASRRRIDVETAD